MNFSDNYFRLSQRHPEVPRLTPAHYEAMELFTSLANSDELRLDGVLQPGDVQILSNHVSKAESDLRDPYQSWQTPSISHLGMCTLMYYAVAHECFVRRT